MDQISIVVLGAVGIFGALLTYLFLNERGARRYALAQLRQSERQAAAEKAATEKAARENIAAQKAAEEKTLRENIAAQKAAAEKAEAEKVLLNQQIARQEKVVALMEMVLPLEEPARKPLKLPPAPEFVGYVPVARPS